MAIRYIDERFLGKVYLVPSERLDTVPVFSEQGPDALDAGLTEEVFLERLRRYRGQVKNVLVNAKFVAGIGNAYVDEILFEAGVHPFTAVKDLSAERRAAVYRAMGERAGAGRASARRRRWASGSTRSRASFCGCIGRAGRRVRSAAGRFRRCRRIGGLRRFVGGVSRGRGCRARGGRRLAAAGEELVGTGEEGAPGGAALEVAEVDLGEAGFGAGGLGAEAHARFVGGAAALAAVAGGAGGDEVFPGVAAAAGAGDDVVEGEVGSGRAAVLTGVAVAGEDFAAREADHGSRAADEVDHADHAGDGEFGGDGAEQGGGAVEVVDHFGLAALDEYECAAHVADMQGLRSSG